MAICEAKPFSTAHFCALSFGMFACFHAAPAAQMEIEPQVMETTVQFPDAYGGSLLWG